MPLTDAQRVYFERMVRDTAFSPKPCVEDIRLLLNEVVRLELVNRNLNLAYDAALHTASDAAFRRAFPDKRS